MFCVCVNPNDVLSCWSASFTKWYDRNACVVWHRRMNRFLFVSCYYCRRLRTHSCSKLGIGIGIHNEGPAARICKCYCKSLLFLSHWSYGPWQVQKKERGGWDAETLCTTAVDLQLDPISATEPDRLCLTPDGLGRFLFTQVVAECQVVHSLLHRVLKTVHLRYKWMAFID